MPRSVSKWNEHEFDRVSETVWENSYGGELFSNLDGHIQRHFPTLVIPTIVQKFEEEVSDAVGEIVRTCYSEINSSKEDYEKACELLHSQNAELREFLSEAQQMLTNSFDNLLDDLKKNPESEEAFEFFVEELLSTDIYRDKISKEKISPLYTCFENIRMPANNVINDMEQILRNGSPEFLGQLPEGLQKKLSSVCHQYNKAKESGKEENFEHNLSQFFSELNFVVNEVITIKSGIENSRIYDAIELLMKHYLNYLQEGVNKRASQWNLSIGHHILKELDKPEIQTIQLTGDVEIKSREDGIWWTLWIVKETVSYKELPSSKTLYDTSLSAIDKQIASLVEPFHLMMRNYLFQLNEKIEAEQARVMNDFETKLTQANAKHHENYDNVLRSWQPLHQQSEQVSNLLSKLIEDGKSA